MADQFAGVDPFGRRYNQQQYEEYDDYAPPTKVSHSYSETVQEIDFNDQHGRRYSAIDFDSTQYMNGFDEYNDMMEPMEKPDTSYAEYAARQKIAQLATVARRHENLLKQQQQAIDEENKKMENAIYQKVERPKNRKQWVNGTHVLVQRDKSTQWFHGTIVNIYNNAMSEEVLTVLYYEFKGAVKYKTVRRYDKNVKAPNEDAWELFKKEEEKDMTLYQKLFTGIKGNENTLFDQLGDIGNNDHNANLDAFNDENGDGIINGENGENVDGDNKEEKGQENGSQHDDDDNDDDDDDGDGKKKKKKKKKKKDKKDKKNKKKKKKKGGDDDEDEEDDDGDDDGDKKKKKKKKDKKKKKKKNKNKEDIDDDDGDDDDDDKKKKKKKKKKDKKKKSKK